MQIICTVNSLLAKEVVHFLNIAQQIINVSLKMVQLHFLDKNSLA